jgi:hypothetical protein
VVKHSAAVFNQVSADQAQEWLNSTGKEGGGIAGITQTQSALCRWALSYNLRSHIVAEISVMHGIHADDTLVHKEGTKSRKATDNKHENSLLATLMKFNVFSVEQNTTLQNIATKDLATLEIQDSLLNALEQGQSQLNKFVQECLVTQTDKFYEPISKNNPPAFATLYEVKKEKATSGQNKILMADRIILHCLVTVYEAGREINMQDILKHELMPVPVSLAETNQTLRTGNKYILADVVTTGVNCPDTIRIDHPSGLIIDGQAF